MKELLFIIIILGIGFMGCKEERVAELKGALVTQSSKEIDYAALFGQLDNGAATPGTTTDSPAVEEDAWVGADLSNQNDLNLLEEEVEGTIKTIRATFLFAFAGGHPGADFPGAPVEVMSSGSYDSGARAASRFLKWLKAQSKGTSPLLPDLQESSNNFPTDPTAAKKGTTYRAILKSAKVPVQYVLNGTRKVGYVAFEIKVVLGSVYGSNPAVPEGLYDQGYSPGSTVMDRSFLEAIADAYLSDHIVSYNGHSWAPDEHQGIIAAISAKKRARFRAGRYLVLLSLMAA